MRQKTFDYLTAGLTALLQTTPYENLTVVMLCKEAGITRRTFYKNYKSIDDLVRKMFLDMFFTDCYDQMTDESYFESDHFIDMLIETYDRYGELFVALDKWNVLEYLTKDNISVIVTTINERFHDSFIRKYSDYFIASTYGSIGNMCMLWLKKGKQENRDELKRIIRSFIYKGVYRYGGQQ